MVRFVKFLFLAGIYLSISVKAALAAEAPKLELLFNPNGMLRELRITSHEPDSFIVNKVVINRKYGTEFCVRTPNQSLSLGETLTVVPNAFCGEPVLVEITTDRGEFEYELSALAR